MTDKLFLDLQRVRVHLTMYRQEKKRLEDELQRVNANIEEMMDTLRVLNEQIDTQEKSSRPTTIHHKEL